MPWGKFWRLLDTLGDGSRYIRAQQNDPEVARYVAEKEAADRKAAEKAGTPPPPPWRPAADDWTLLHELMARNLDRTGMVATLIADLPTTVKTRTPFPSVFSRPETLLDRYRREIAEAEDKAADDRLMDLVTAAKQRWRDQNPGAATAAADQ